MGSWYFPFLRILYPVSYPFRAISHMTKRRRKKERKKNHKEKGRKKIKKTTLHAKPCRNPLKGS